MKRFLVIVGAISFFSLQGFAKTHEYIDIDALMQDRTSPKVHKTPSVRKIHKKEVVRSEGNHIRRRDERSGHVKVHRKDRRFFRQPRSSKYSRRSPEFYVRRHYGPEWRRYRLRDARSHIHRGYLRPKRGWVLAYAYDHAAFYDRFGFLYGDFDRLGFMFEGRWFQYNEHYTYHDRLRGRGYFDYRYYIPRHARRYGFCAP